MKRLLKQGLLTAVSRVTGRTAVLLPAAASSEHGILSVVAPYRVDGETLSIEVCHPLPGEMRVSLHDAADGHPAGVCRFPYGHPGPLMLRLRDGALWFAGRAVGNLSGMRPVVARRFSVDLELVDQDGSLRRRSTGHYLPRDGAAVDESYYTGEDYVDYEAQSADVHRDVLDLVRRHGFEGPILEIGCATGGTLAALRAAGYDAFGLDYSAWAIERARAHVGDAARLCDAERDALPELTVSKGPFKCFVLAAVLEHFAHPQSVLAKLGAVAAPGAGLIIITSNGNSFTHRILGSDWEGYFDWTHKSVDAVTPRSLRSWLCDLGWTIRELRTWHLWDGSSDPTHATLRDWHAADARFRTLLAERELGDFITCVAVLP